MAYYCPTTCPFAPISTEIWFGTVKQGIVIRLSRSPKIHNFRSLENHVRIKLGASIWDVRRNLLFLTPSPLVNFCPNLLTSLPPGRSHLCSAMLYPSRAAQFCFVEVELEVPRIRVPRDGHRPSTRISEFFLLSIMIPILLYTSIAPKDLGPM